MHILQSKHTKLSEEEATKILEELNISKTQLSRIPSTDAAIPNGCQRGDIIKLERKEGSDTIVYFRVVV